MTCTGTTFLVLCTSMGLLLFKRRVLSVCVQPGSLVPDNVTAGVTSWSRITFCVFVWQCNSVTALNWCRIPSMGNVWLWSGIGLTARRCVAVKLRTVIQPSMMVKHQLTAVGPDTEWLVLCSVITYWTMWQLHFAVVFEEWRLEY